MAESILSAHGRGSRLVTRAELETIPMPVALGAIHKPIPHFELVRTLAEVIEAHDLKITREQYAVQDSSSRGVPVPGALLFGVFEVSSSGLMRWSREGMSFALGFRSGNNLKMTLQLAAGVRVFVCDNLAFNGDLVALQKRHTIGLDLRAEIVRGVERYLVQQIKAVDQIDRATAIKLGDARAKEIIYDTFLRGVLPLRFLPEVHANFFEPAPEWTDCHGRTLWGLHNAFTRVLAPTDVDGQRVERIPPRSKFEATAELGKLLML